MCGKTKEKEAILLSYDWEKLAQGQGCRGMVWGGMGQRKYIVCPNYLMSSIKAMSIKRAALIIKGECNAIQFQLF